MTNKFSSEEIKVSWLPKNIFAKVAFFILFLDGLQGFISTKNLLFLVEIAVAFLLSPKIYTKFIK